MQERVPAAGRQRGAGRRLYVMLLLAPALAACQDALKPTEEPVASVGAVTADTHTLLHLPFNDNVVAEDGTSPVEASGLSFENGINGSGIFVDGSDRLSYGTAGNFNAGAGTIEFWIKPRWQGTDRNDRFFFTMGDALWIVKDAADNLRFFLGPEDSEGHQGYNLGAWAADQWHHIAVTWTVPGELKTYVDGVVRISHAASSQDLVSSIPPTMTIGSRSGVLQANAVIDELTISDIAMSAEQIAARMATGPKLLRLNLQPITLEPFVTWRQPAKLIAETAAGTHEYSAGVAEWSSSNPAIATVDANGIIRAVSAGNATITAVVDGVQGNVAIRVKNPVLQPVLEPIPAFLATPAANSLYQIPVVIIRFLPTTDGTNLDVSVNPDFWWLNPVSLQGMQQRIDTLDIRTKFMLEEGSKFRGYQDPSAMSSIGYRVVAYITVYEPTPPGKVAAEAKGFPVYERDHHQIFDRFNARHYVEDLGVKEFWIWDGGFDANSPSYNPSIHKPESFRTNAESNMSSPITGDISNSGRDPNDLPIYSKTYLVYSHNLRRGESEAVHNRGHQLEQMLEYANVRQDGNSILFWQKFVGPTPGLAFRRCGWTHVPPNSTGEYDYHTNYQEVLSDIADWTPAGTGRKALVSAHTWGDHPYSWPLGTMPAAQEQRNEDHWYIYWMQSMPGRANTIPYGRNQMTNWWSFTGDWDNSSRSRLGLYQRAPNEPTCGPIRSSVTAARAVRALGDRVQSLVQAGKLTQAEGHALGGKLEGAARLFDQNRSRPAVNIVKAFANQLRALIQSGRLRQSDGGPLLQRADCLINGLRR